MYTSKSSKEVLTASLQFDLKIHKFFFSYWRTFYRSFFICQTVSMLSLESLIMNIMCSSMLDLIVVRQNYKKFLLKQKRKPKKKTFLS